MPHIESFSTPVKGASGRTVNLYGGMMGVRDGFDDALDIARLMIANDDVVSPGELHMLASRFAEAVDGAVERGFHKSAREVTADERQQVRAAIEIAEASGEWLAPESLGRALDAADGLSGPSVAG